MKISIIAAIGEGNRAIGKDGKLPPWKAKGDLKRFKELTNGKICIMGRKTYESIKAVTPVVVDEEGKSRQEVLPGRIKIVVSTTLEPDSGQLLVVETPEFAMHFAKHMLAKFKGMSEEIMVIGGEQIYKAFLPLCTNMYLTHVKGTWEGDAFFPQVDLTSDKTTPEATTFWTKTFEEDCETHTFCNYEKGYIVPIVVEAPPIKKPTWPET